MEVLCHKGIRTYFKTVGSEETSAQEDRRQNL